MEKTFSKIEISVIKSTAKNVAPFVAKKAKVDAQIEETKMKIQKTLEEKLQKLEAEKAGYQSIIDSMNGAVKKITETCDEEGNVIHAGYTTEDLVETKKEATGQMDQKTGKEIFKTVYVLKYPETVVPPTTEGAGSDYDKDAESFQQPETEGTEEHQGEEPEGMAESEAEEMPEEMMAEQAEIAGVASEADPFADVDPFNQQ
jgi:hypothetical protein